MGEQSMQGGSVNEVTESQKDMVCVRKTWLELVLLIKLLCYLQEMIPFPSYLEN